MTPNHRRLMVIAIVSILVSIARSQDRTAVVLNQPLSGLSTGSTSSIRVGLPFPMRPSPLRNERSMSGSDGRIDVPVELGSDVSWSVFDVRGRTVSQGSVVLSEAGGRELRIDDLGDAAVGIYFIVLRSNADASVVLRYLKR